MIKIRRTSLDDIPSLTRIVHRNYAKETAEHFFDEINLSFSSALCRPWFYTAEDDELGVVGCAGYGTSWLAYGAYSLFWVNVDVRAQRRGVGTTLVQQCIDDLSHRATLILLATTIPGFYSKNWGFAARTDFSSDQTTYTLMSLELGP